MLRGQFGRIVRELVPVATLGLAVQLARLRPDWAQGAFIWYVRWCYFLATWLVRLSLR